MYSRTTSRMVISIRSDESCSSNTQSTFKVQNLPKICLHPVQYLCACATWHRPRLRMIPNQPCSSLKIRAFAADLFTLVAVGYTYIPTVWMNRYRADFSLRLFLLIFHVFYIEGYSPPPESMEMRPSYLRTHYPVSVGDKFSYEIFKRSKS